MNNPFVYNAPVPPDKFIGRSQQVNQILDQLANPARSSSAISGDPCVGKTSLLHYLRTPKVHEAWGLSSSCCHFLKIDGHSIVPFTDTTFWRNILRELEQPLSGHEILAQHLQRALALPVLEMFDLNSLFDQIARAGHLVVLMLDEFEILINSLDPNSPNLLYHLRALLNRPERGLALIVASRKPLEQLCADFNFTGSPLGNSFATIALPPFADEDIDKLLERYQVSFSDAERTFLRQTAGTHPFLVQLTGAFMLRAREAHHPAAETSFTQLEAGLERRTEGYFLDILQHCREPEKMLLTWLALAQLTQHLPPDLVRWGESFPTLGRYHQDLNHLLERGLVQDKPAGPVLFSAIFGRWVLRQLLVTPGREILAAWQSHLAAFLSPAQQKFFQEIVESIIEHPTAIAKPELLIDVLAQSSRSQTTPVPVSSTSSIRLGGPISFFDAPKRDVIKQLYAESELRVVQVRLEQRFHGGLSGAEVILAQPIDDRGRALAYEVVKIAPATMLRREHSRYRQFIRGRLPATAVRLENGPVELGLLGCLSYGFAGDRPIGAIKDLEDYYATHSAEAVIETLNRLMEALDARWYGQHETFSVSFAEEYEQQLPAHLKLLAEKIIPGHIDIPDSHRLLDVETILNAPERLKIGERVAIAGLQVSQVMPDTVKLHSTDDGTIIWIRARVTLPYLDLQEKDQVTLLGIIESRRDDVLAAAAASILSFTPDLRRQPDNALHLTGLDVPCPNPLAIYKQILKQQLNGRKTIIHGDLHPGNILVDGSGRAWLIDFDHVREGHVLFDFVRLETLLRLFIIGNIRRFKRQSDPPITGWPHNFTLPQYVAFETSLLRQTLNQPAPKIDHAELAKAAEVIMVLRRSAQHYLRHRNDWREYFTGLFLQNLAQLRFYQDEPWLGALPFITAAVVGREIGD